MQGRLPHGRPSKAQHHPPAGALSKQAPQHSHPGRQPDRPGSISTCRHHHPLPSVCQWSSVHVGADQDGGGPSSHRQHEREDKAAGRCSCPRHRPTRGPCLDGLGLWLCLHLCLGLFLRLCLCFYLCLCLCFYLCFWACIWSCSRLYLWFWPYPWAQPRPQSWP